MVDAKNTADDGLPHEVACVYAIGLALTSKGGHSQAVSFTNHLRHHAGLPHAGFTGDGDHLAPPVAGIGQPLSDHYQFVVSTKHWECVTNRA